MAKVKARVMTAQTILGKNLVPNDLIEIDSSLIKSLVDAGALSTKEKDVLYVTKDLKMELIKLPEAKKEA